MSSREMKFLFDGKVEATLSEEIIEEVFHEWETEHPGQTARAMSGDEFADRLMKKFRSSARRLS